MISWFRFVRHAEVALYERRGWVAAADLGPVHGAWSVLMRWTGENELTGVEVQSAGEEPCGARA